MDRTQRWLMAQNYEKGHWQQVAGELAAGGENLAWYRWKAERTQQRLAHCGVGVTGRCNIVEVGSGPVGLITFLPGNRRYAVDPLMGFFNKDEGLTSERSDRVEYLEGKGEELPLEDATCDLVVIDNCLDHCEDPGRVMRECRRVLGPAGHLYLTLNVRSSVGWLNRSLMELFRLDPGHPHSYSPNRLRELIESHAFDERAWWIQSWRHSVAENWADNPKHTAAKIVTLTIERLAEGVWKTS